MDVILLISSIITFGFGALWLSDEYFNKNLKKLVICCMIINIISLISLQHKTVHFSFIESNIMIINNQVIKFNKPVKIKQIITKRTYGTDMLDEINYEILN